MILVLLPVLSVVSVSKKQPHILFIVADDYGWNDVGYHTDPKAAGYLNTANPNGIHLTLVFHIKCSTSPLNYPCFSSARMTDQLTKIARCVHPYPHPKVTAFPIQLLES